MEQIRCTQVGAGFVHQLLHQPWQGTGQAVQAKLAVYSSFTMHMYSGAPTTTYPTSVSYTSLGQKASQNGLYNLFKGLQVKKKHHWSSADTKAPLSQLQQEYHKDHPSRLYSSFSLQATCLTPSRKGQPRG